MKKTLLLAAGCLLLAACSGADTVMTVDGVVFDVDDIPITTDDSTVALDIYRNALNWVIADEVLTSAAEEQFGITFPPDQVRTLAEAGLATSDPQDPRSNLAFLEIQAKYGQQGLLWQGLGQALPEGVLPIQWALDQLRTADIEISPKYGEWRIDPEPAVYAP